jgi:hypothetical protein
MRCDKQVTGHTVWKRAVILPAHKCIVEIQGVTKAWQKIKSKWDQRFSRQWRCRWWWPGGLNHSEDRHRHLRASSTCQTTHSSPWWWRQQVPLKRKLLADYTVLQPRRQPSSTEYDHMNIGPWKPPSWITTLMSVPHGVKVRKRHPKGRR